MVSKVIFGEAKDLDDMLQKLKRYDLKNITTDAFRQENKIDLLFK